MTNKNQPLPDALILIHDSTSLGGAELHLLEILKVCQKKGIPAYLITSKAGTLFEQFKKLTKTQCMVPIPYPRKPKTWIHLPRFLKTCKRFLRGVQANTPCILVGDFYPLWAALKLKKYAPILSLWQGEYRFDSNECIEKWIRYGANRADLLLANEAVSRHAKATDLLAPPLATLNPKIDTDRFNPNHYDKIELRKRFGWTKPTAVCVGRYGEGKGQPWLVEQFLQDEVLYKNWKLILVGSISETDNRSLKKLLEKRDPDKHIEVWGERHDIPEIYAAADVALFPGTVQESYGLAVLEAITLRTPIIAMASGALPFLLGNSIQLIPSKQRNILIQAWRENPTANTLKEAPSVLSTNMEEQLLGAFGKIAQ